MSIRVEKVNSLVLQTLSGIIQKEIPFDYGIVNINSVETSSDLSVAKVFYGVLGSEDQVAMAKDYIEQHARSLQHLLTQQLRHMKTVPKLRFIHDQGSEHSVRIAKILDDLKAKEEG